MKTKIKFFKSALTILCLLLSAPFITAQQAQNASYPDDPARETRPESSRGTVIGVTCVLGLLSCDERCTQ